MIAEAAKKQGTPIQPHDVIVVTHVVVSKSEGNIVNLDEVKPSQRAIEIAKQTNKDPALVEVILRETKEIVRIGPNSIITETQQRHNLRQRRCRPLKRFRRPKRCALAKKPQCISSGYP